MDTSFSLLEMSITVQWHCSIKYVFHVHVCVLISSTKMMQSDSVGARMLTKHQTAGKENTKKGLNHLRMRWLQ